MFQPLMWTTMSTHTRLKPTLRLFEGMESLFENALLEGRLQAAVDQHLGDVGGAGKQ